MAFTGVNFLEDPGNSKLRAFQTTQIYYSAEPKMAFIEPPTKCLLALDAGKYWGPWMPEATGKTVHCPRVFLR
jgi:hypothetical protein